MHKEPFSIVIPVYNRADSLQATLNSLLSQSYRPLHIILVDNASTDSTLNTLNSWAKTHQSPDFNIEILSESRLGAAAARNRGLEAVTTPHMLFFDSDDILLPTAISKYMEIFSSTKADVVLSKGSWIDLKGKRHSLPIRKGNLLLTHLHHCSLRTQAYAATTELFRKVGGWDSSLRIWDDWELGFRLILSNPKIVNANFKSYEIHQSSDSITGLKYSHKAQYYETPIEKVRRILTESHLPNAPRLAAMMNYRLMMLSALFSKEKDSLNALKFRHTALQSIKESGWQKHKRCLLLKLAYIYIKHGGRGFDRIINSLY